MQPRPYQMGLGGFGVSGAFKQAIKHGLCTVDTFEPEHHGCFRA